MNELLTRAIEAHGGITRWQELTRAQATIVSGGHLFAVKGLPQDPAPRRMTVRLHEEHASVEPFGAPDQKTDFSPGRVAIVKLDGRVVAERKDPRRSFTGHVLETPWDPLDRAYFNGYALWTYLTTPFLLSMPGFTVTEIEAWREGGEAWRGLRATFPSGIASHSTHQDFYFGPDHLLQPARLPRRRRRWVRRRAVRVRLRGSGRHRAAHRTPGLPPRHRRPTRPR